MKNHQTLAAGVAVLIVVAYNIACGYARCVRALLNRRSFKELSSSESELAEKYGELSVATLYIGETVDRGNPQDSQG